MVRVESDRRRPGSGDSPIPGVVSNRQSLSLRSRTESIAVEIEDQYDGEVKEASVEVASWCDSSGRPCIGIGEKAWASFSAPQGGFEPPKAVSRSMEVYFIRTGRSALTSPGANLHLQALHLGVARITGSSAEGDFRENAALWRASGDNSSSCVVEEFEVIDLCGIELREDRARCRRTGARACESVGVLAYLKSLGSILRGLWLLPERNQQNEWWNHTSTV